jgi:hypothetical protein
VQNGDNKTGGTQRQSLFEQLQFRRQIHVLFYYPSSMLSDGLQTSQAIKTYRLSGNRITEKSANVLLNTINKFAQEIDLSKNKIGSLGC